MYLLRISFAATSLPILMMMMLPFSTAFVVRARVCFPFRHDRWQWDNTSDEQQYRRRTMIIRSETSVCLRQVSGGGGREEGKDPSQGEHRQQPQELILPIFPLRKRVKFPTQTLQLTLWEERYKALSRKVLESDSDTMKLFGALYCSHKTQIVTGGINPITPLVEVGDIGVVCSVLNSQIFVDGKEVDEDRIHDENVQKIRINGLAVGRFRVEEILSHGFDIRDNQEGDDNSDDDDVLPFIMVKGSRLDDDEVFQLDNNEYFVGQVQDLQQRVLQLRGSMNLAGCVIPTPEQLITDDYTWSFDTIAGNEECQKRQLLSFAITSQFETNTSSSEMLGMLQCTSTSERIAYIEEKLLPKSNGIFSMPSSFIK